MTTTTSARALHTACVLALLAGACGAPAPSASVPVVDFIRTFDRADQRPPGAYQIADHLAGGTRHPAIIAPSPGRITWTLPIPRRAVLRAVVASLGPAPVRVRIGVSDDRIYEALAAVTVADPEDWRPLTADLSAYAGWKFSLFYRPERRVWRVNVSIDAVNGVPGRVAIGDPVIVTDSAAALEYDKRRARLIRSAAP